MRNIGKFLKIFVYFFICVIFLKSLQTNPVIPDITAYIICKERNKI
jgi:hypothetical protein